MLLFHWLVGWMVGWVGCPGVCRDMDGFEVESFILGCQLPLPPLLSLSLFTSFPPSLLSLSFFFFFQSTFVFRAAPVSLVPWRPGSNVYVAVVELFLCCNLLCLVCFLGFTLCVWVYAIPICKHCERPCVCVLLCVTVLLCTWTSKAGFKKAPLCCLMQLLAL